MLQFADVDTLLATQDGTKWRRVAEAVRRADQVLPEVTYSIGDSVTYRVTARPDCPQFTGHRRYLELRAVVDGTAEIEVAPVSELTASNRYSDLADRQRFTGTGRRHELAAGGIVVVDPAEAIRDIAVTGRVMVLRVTVEG